MKKTLNCIQLGVGERKNDYSLKLKNETQLQLQLNWELINDRVESKVE